MNSIVERRADENRFHFRCQSQLFASVPLTFVCPRIALTTALPYPAGGTNLGAAKLLQWVRTSSWLCWVLRSPVGPLLVSTLTRDIRELQTAGRQLARRLKKKQAFCQVFTTWGCAGVPTVGGTPRCRLDCRSCRFVHTVVGGSCRFDKPFARRPRHD